MRRRLPSPSLAISLLALFVSLGGVGYAAATIGTSQIKNGAVTGRKIHNSTIKSRDVRKNSLGPHAIAESKLRVGSARSAGSALVSSGLSDFAVVGANGLVARGRGVSSAVRTGEGRYQVIFTRNVRGCAYVASLGVIGATPPGSGEVSTSSLSSNVDGVFIRTFNSNGAPGDHSFHLLVGC
ncbi:MAG TPA: hypothetical protein VGF21_03455 [Thermoleophilaceae bacterium]|jgi:hypothetical protein